MKKIITKGLSAAIALSVLAGCGSSSAASTESTSAASTAAETTAAVSAAAQTGKYKVGISMFVMDAGMTALSGLMTQQLENAGIETVVTSADSSMEKQNSDVEDLVTQGCDLIWVQGFDRDAITGALEYAIDNGVKVAIGASANTDAYTYQYQNASDEETGLMQAAWFAENYLSKNPDTTYEIALCNGTMSTAGGKGRRDGVVHGLEKSGYTNYEIVTEQDNDYITETAQSWAEGLMLSHPEVNVIFSANDDMALGVANAIEADGRTGEIILLGTDGQEVGLSLLKEGKMSATVRMNVEEVGKSMAQSMIDCLNGTLVIDENKIATGDASKIYTMLDQTNYQQFLN